jgi:hypothetical protein
VQADDSGSALECTQPLTGDFRKIYRIAHGAGRLRTIKPIITTATTIEPVSTRPRPAKPYMQVTPLPAPAGSRVERCLLAASKLLEMAGTAAAMILQ